MSNTTDGVLIGNTAYGICSKCGCMSNGLTPIVKTITVIRHRPNTYTITEYLCTSCLEELDKDNKYVKC